MQTFIAVTPEEEQDAARLHRPLAHVAYRIGPSSSLLRRNLLLQTRGGLLSVSDRDSPPWRTPEPCAPRCCGVRPAGLPGGAAGLRGPAPPGPAGPGPPAGERLPAARRTLYVPEGYASAAPAAPVLVNAAVSGGSWEEYLREQIRRLGPGRLALDLERVRMDFSLPAPSGQGTPLSGQELARLLEQARPAVSSPRSCAPGTSPAPGTGKPTSSSSTTPGPSAASSGPPPPWAAPPRFSCGRRSGTWPGSCFSREPGDAGGRTGRPRAKKSLCRTAQRFFTGLDQ